MCIHVLRYKLSIDAGVKLIDHMTNINNDVKSLKLCEVQLTYENNMVEHNENNNTVNSQESQDAKPLLLSLFSLSFWFLSDIVSKDCSNYLL